MIKPTILNESSIERFRDNINNQRYMVVWCYYEPGNKYGTFIDIAKTSYRGGPFNIGARGIGYLSFFSDQSIDDCSLEGLQKHIHSFLEMEEPKVYPMMRNSQDCLRVCLNILLKIPYEDIPQFFDIDDVFTHKEFDDKYDSWLNSKGYKRLKPPVIKLAEYILKYCNDRPSLIIGVLHKDDKDYSHAVIIRLIWGDDKCEILLEHDPKPDTDYTIDDLVEIDVIYKT